MGTSAAKLEDEMTTVYRYQNRKMYIKGEGKYVTAPQLLALAKAGEVTVIDHKTKTDVTAGTLLSALTHVMLPKLTLDSTQHIIKLVKRYA
jgi:polyhydroxyalkanoate synthesis regulator protein